MFHQEIYAGVEQLLRLRDDAGRRLAEKAWLIMVDVVREKNQSREEYLHGYLKCMCDHWIMVPPV